MDFGNGNRTCADLSDAAVANYDIRMSSAVERSGDTKVTFSITVPVSTFVSAADPAATISATNATKASNYSVAEK
jgi:hypothetical protein